jgi:hypothetical protein
VTIAQNGRLTVGKFLIPVAFVALFGGYTAVGNRMDRFVRWWEWLRTPGKRPPELCWLRLPRLRPWSQLLEKRAAVLVTQLAADSKEAVRLVVTTALPIHVSERVASCGVVVSASGLENAHGSVRFARSAFSVGQGSPEIRAVLPSFCSASAFIQCACSHGVSVDTAPLSEHETEVSAAQSIIAVAPCAKICNRLAVVVR